MTYIQNSDGIKIYATHFLRSKAIRKFLQHAQFMEEFDKKILDNSLERFIRKIFEYRFEKAIQRYSGS